jgi:hypothetical protein
VTEGYLAAGMLHTLDVEYEVTGLLLPGDWQPFDVLNSAILVRASSALILVGEATLSYQLHCTLH